MSTQYSEFQKLIDGIVQECREDQEGLWSIIAAIENSGIATKPTEIRKITIHIIRTMLSHEDIIAMDYNNNKYHVWNLSMDDIIAKIEKAWNQLEQKPNIGDIVWFTSKNRLSYLPH